MAKKPPQAKWMVCNFQLSNQFVCRMRCAVSRPDDFDRGFLGRRLQQLRTVLRTRQKISIRYEIFFWRDFFPVCFVFRVRQKTAKHKMPARKEVSAITEEASKFVGRIPAKRSAAKPVRQLYFFFFIFEKSWFLFYFYFSMFGLPRTRTHPTARS